jgi:hypothetical protein
LTAAGLRCIQNASRYFPVHAPTFSRQMKSSAS